MQKFTNWTHCNNEKYSFIFQTVDLTCIVKECTTIRSAQFPRYSWKVSAICYQTEETALRWLRYRWNIFLLSQERDHDESSAPRPTRQNERHGRLRQAVVRGRRKEVYARYGTWSHRTMGLRRQHGLEPSLRPGPPPTPRAQQGKFSQLFQFIICQIKRSMTAYFRLGHGSDLAEVFSSYGKSYYACVHRTSLCIETNMSGVNVGVDSHPLCNCHVNVCFELYTRRQSSRGSEMSTNLR